MPTPFRPLEELETRDVPDATFTPFDVPRGASAPAPNGIVTGPDGALWFTQYAAAKIGRVTTAGEFSEFTIPGPVGSSDITAGPDGALWFTDQAGVGVGRITTDGEVRLFPLPGTLTSYQIAAGPDGALWFTTGAGVGRITTGGSVSTISVPHPGGTFTYGITAGPDGALWFTEVISNMIGRMAVDGTFTEFPIPTPNIGPQGITAGPDGALWFGAANKIGRITTDGVITEFAVPPDSNGGAVPQELTTGPDGAIWFTLKTGFESQLGRITTDGVITKFGRPATNGSNPFDITTGPDAALWYTDELANTVVRVTLNGILPPPPPPPPPPVAQPGAVLVGGTANGIAVVLNPSGSTYTTAGAVTFFAGFTGEVRTATADVNADGVPDYVGGVGPGGSPRVSVIDGRTGARLADVFAFEESFTGGVFVAAGDLNADGRAEVIVTPDQGGGPNVVIFAPNADGTLAAPKAFFALGNPSFRGGARPAVGDLNNDGAADLAVGAGFLGGPNVEIHDGREIADGDFVTLIGRGFFAFDGPDATTLRNGVFLAIGDLNGDGFADLIAGGGPGGGPRVLALDGEMLSTGDVSGAYAAPVANFFFGDDSNRGGVRVAAKDADGDPRADLVVGSGEGLSSRVRVYLGKDFADTGEPDLFQDLDPFGTTLPGGVFVG